QALEKEYEKVQYSLTHEKEVLHKLESVYSKLEAELKSLEIQHEDKLELQSKEIHHYQESIMTIAFDINEMQSSKINLETEIIIYRYILNAFENEEQVTIVPHKSTVANETIGKFIAKGRKKHSIGIKECAANGKYISLLNYSTTDDIDISKWMLKQSTDSASEIQYIIPDGVVLKQGIELRIYSKLGSANKDRSSNENTHSRLVNNNVTSWDIGQFPTDHAIATTRMRPEHQSRFHGLNTLLYNASVRLSYHFNLQGLNVSLDVACSSFLEALRMAVCGVDNLVLILMVMLKVKS
ncbi:unnamed protein product, partial [Adineta steineri]